MLPTCWGSPYRQLLMSWSPGDVGCLPSFILQDAYIILLLVPLPWIDLEGWHIISWPGFMHLWTHLEAPVAPAESWFDSSSISLPSAFSVALYSLVSVFGGQVLTAVLPLCNNWGLSRRCVEVLCVLFIPHPYCIPMSNDVLLEGTRWQTLNLVSFTPCAYLCEECVFSVIYLLPFGMAYGFYLLGFLFG